MTRMRKEWCERCDGCGWHEGGAYLKTVCLTCNGSGIVIPVTEDNMTERATTIIHRDLGLEVDKASVRITRQSTGQVIELSMTEWNWLYQVSVLFDWPMAAPVGNAVPDNVS